MMPSPDPSSSSTSVHPLKIAHVLFMDIVAYSQLPMDEQTRLIELLQTIVRSTSGFTQAQKRRQLLRLPTGDGMALVFFSDPEAPARCALEIGHLLREHPELRLRMGIHTGPVQRLEDINANRNVAGGGINLAQRVMDCGDAGHILVSSAVADMLSHMTSWKLMLHDLGAAEVKHGVRVHLYNLFTDEAGNRDLPQKLVAARKAVSKTKRKKVSLATVAAGVVVAMGIVGYFHSVQARRLTDKDTVVLADFENKTGDAIFDDTLKQALSVALSQSPFLNVLSENKVATTLKQMSRPADAKLTPDVFRELGQRTGSKAYIMGSIANLGSQYVLGLKAVNCLNGDRLAQEQVAAASKEKVLDALGEAASKLRGELGESLPTVQKFDVPLSEATTSSLEALKSYSMGIEIDFEQGDAPALPFLKRAVELDPNFPLAEAVLAIKYFNLNQPSLGLEYATKAYQQRDRVGDREKLAISSTYFQATGELEKEVQIYEMWAPNYPRDDTPRASLGQCYAVMGQYDKALAEYQEAFRLDSDSVYAYSSLGFAYIALNRLDEAAATFDQALARKLDSYWLRQSMYVLAFLRGDKTQMEQQVAWGAGKPGDEDPLLYWQSDTEAYYGRMTKAREFSRRAVDSALRADSKESAALYQVNVALREASVGNTAAARQAVTAGMALSSGREVKKVAALALALTGNAPRAKALADELEKDNPTNTLLNLYWLPTINAATKLKKNTSSEAIVLLEAAAPYDLSDTGSMYPVNIRGQAYLLAHNGAAAAVEFQKILDHRGRIVNDVTGALAHLQIGRAYAMAGETAKAKAAYQDFLTLWKDADPDIPILKEAKAEYAKLQ
jgi:class 3 adenylate cyclase/tetratricopeptide (TPR) repeat protein